MEDNQQRRIFGSAVAGVLSVHIFRVTEEGQTVFQRDCFQVRVHIAPYHHQNLISLDPFSFVNLGKVLQYLFVVCLFFFHFPITKMAEDVFMFLGHLDFFLCNVPSKDLSKFLLAVCLFLNDSQESFRYSGLYIYWILVFCQLHVLQICSPRWFPIF